MKVESVGALHDARTWALEGITQHSLDVTGVAGDHLNVDSLRYIATHPVTQEVEGYLEGKYFWGVFWVSHVYAHHKHALASLLLRAAHDIQHVCVQRIIMTTESKTVYTYLTELGLIPVYAPSAALHHSQTDVDDRYVFDWSCSTPLLGCTPSQDHNISFGTVQHRQYARTGEAASTQRFAWVAKSPADVYIGYIELGIRTHQAHLRLLYTDPMYRGQGIARALVDTAAQHAILQKCTLFTVETLSYQASTFYEKQGFHKVLTLEGLRPMCVSTPNAIPKLSNPLSFIFLTRLLS